MSFGISGSPTLNRMIGGDVVVAGVDQNTISGFAQDYYLLDKSQCIIQQDSGQVSGSCPDSNIQVYKFSKRFNSTYNIYYLNNDNHSKIILLCKKTKNKICLNG